MSITVYIKLLNDFNIQRFDVLIYGLYKQNPNPECLYRYQSPILSQISNVTQALRGCNYTFNRAEKPQQPASLILLKNESSLAFNTGEFFLLASLIVVTTIQILPFFRPSNATVVFFFVQMSAWQNLTSLTLICPDLSHSSANWVP